MTRILFVLWAMAGVLYAFDNSGFPDDPEFGDALGRASNGQPECFDSCDSCLACLCCPCGPRYEGFPAKPSGGSVAVHAILFPCLPVVGCFTLGYWGLKSLATLCCGGSSSRQDPLCDSYGIESEEGLASRAQQREMAYVYA